MFYATGGSESDAQEYVDASEDENIMKRISTERDKNKSTTNNLINADFLSVV